MIETNAKKPKVITREEITLSGETYIPVELLLDRSGLNEKKVIAVIKKLFAEINDLGTWPDKVVRNHFGITDEFADINEFILALYESGNQGDKINTMPIKLDQQIDYYQSLDTEELKVFILRGIRSMLEDPRKELDHSKKIAVFDVVDMQLENDLIIVHTECLIDDCSQQDAMERLLERRI